jgi:hypothetical protein
VDPEIEAVPLILDVQTPTLDVIKIGHTWGLHYKTFMIIIYNRNDSTIVIYDHNESGQYYKTINYDPRVIIYDPSLSNY